MAKNNDVRDFVKDIADALRAKKKSTEKINPQNFSTEIANLTTGGYNITQVVEGDYCDLYIDDADDVVVKYECLAVDYDGTILKHEFLPKGAEFELPEFPQHDLLIAQEWSSPLQIINNKITVDERGVIAGVVYETKSGLTEIDIELFDGDSLVVWFGINGTKDWGDGVVDDYEIHTYDQPGKYTITTAATEIVAGFSEIGVLSPGLDADCKYCTAIRFGRNVTRIGDIDGMVSLRYITIPNTVISIQKTNIDTTYYSIDAALLKSLIIPNSVTSIVGPLVCGDLLVLPYTMSVVDSIETTTKTMIFPSIPTINVFRDSFVSKLIIPNGVETVGNLYCDLLKELVLPDTLTTIGTVDSYLLEKLDFPDNVVSCRGVLNSNVLKTLTLPEQTMEISNMNYLRSLREFVIPENVTVLPRYFMRGNKSLTKLMFPKTITSVGSSFCSGTELPIVFDFTKSETVPSVAINPPENRYHKIVVPDSLYEEWKNSSVWSDFKNQIYKASEVKL